MEKKEKPYILLVGSDAKAKDFLFQLKINLPIKEMGYDSEDLLVDALNPPPAIIICSTCPEGVSHTEVAQSLRMFYQSTAIFYLTSERKNFNRTIFKKNGFTDAFLLPGDHKTFTESLESEVTQATGGEIKYFRSVKLVDITPGTVLGFDLYIPMSANNKYIRYSSGREALDPVRAKRLAKHEVNSVHVTTDQMSHFYKFAAKQLKTLSNSSKLSETEKAVRREQAVRDILSDVFSESSGTEDSFDRGKQILDDCQEIVKAYVTSDDASKSSWYEKLTANTGNQSSTYNHAANTATFAALFSIGLGIGKPEDLALAGILHDIGLADIPIEIQQKREEDLTPEEKAIYYKHPEFSLNLIKARKLIVSDLVLKMIAQHHERFNGTGFPRALVGGRICPEAQVLALADYFDELTSVQSGRTRLSAAEAMRKLYNESITNPSAALFDPAILKKILELFPGS